MRELFILAFHLLVAQEQHPSRSAALKAECALKQRTREEKLAWVQETGARSRKP